MKPATPEAYELMHRGALALASLEEAGMRVDIDYLDRALVKTTQRIAALKERLWHCEEYALQRRRFGTSVNITSKDQLAVVLFDDMGHHPRNWTATGKPKMDETALEQINSQYTRGILRLEKLIKLNSTYLLGVRNAVDGEYLHPFFNLHNVRSYRGSSDSPNLQNIPVRDPMVAKVIRRAFIPRDGHALVECDYSGQEVRVACCISGDEKLTYDTLEGDMHRDMAAECYMVERSNVSKGMRQAAKGGFVFAQFYGDWYKKCAVNLWDEVERRKLETADGVPLIKHLASRGIVRLGTTAADEPTQSGTFEAHLEKVERRFWGERFKVYSKARRQWWDTYERQGWLKMVTGFVVSGVMEKNQVINYPVQGPAFHCLLWSLIRLVRELKRRKMRSKVVGQVHDSIVGDVHLKELDDYVQLVHEISVERLSRAWCWLTVPLSMDSEVAYDNWFSKEAYNGKA